MERLIIYPNSLAQWHALVEEARRMSDISLNEDLESYLVFLLMRFAQHPEIVNCVLAPDYLQNIKRHRKENQQTLKDIGDKCLLFSGLFPGIAKHRLVRISYYVKLGQSAYCSLSESHTNALAKFYADLGYQFVSLMEVLQSIRELDPKTQVLDLLEAESLWADTKSKHALKILQQKTNGFLAPMVPNSPAQKH